MSCRCCHVSGFAETREARDIARMLRHMIVRPYGVLGTQLSQGHGVVHASTEPDRNVAIVDPAGAP